MIGERVATILTILAVVTAGKGIANALKKGDAAGGGAAYELGFPKQMNLGERR